MLNTFLCSDYVEYQIYPKDNPAQIIRIEILFKDSRNGILYIIGLYHEENSLVCFKIVEEELEDSYHHEIVFIDSEEVDKNLMKIADDYVKANAEFRSNVGLKATITRTVASGCCKWCDELVMWEPVSLMF